MPGALILQLAIGRVVGDAVFPQNAAAEILAALGLGAGLRINRVGKALPVRTHRAFGRDRFVPMARLAPIRPQVMRGRQVRRWHDRLSRGHKRLGVDLPGSETGWYHSILVCRARSGERD